MNPTAIFVPRNTTSFDSRCTATSRIIELKAVYCVMAHLLCAWALHIFNALFFWQVAVAQYSEEPRAAFHFNQHRDRNSVLRAVRGLGYTGGNTKTGVYGWGAHVGWIFWTKTEDVDQGQHLSECFKPIYKARKLWPKVLQNCKWGT